MANFNLTTNCLEKIMTGVACEKPIVQVLGQKKIVTAAQGPERYRLLLSDGKNSVSSVMLATQLNEKVTSGQIDTNAVIRLDKYICNIIQAEKRVIVLLEVTVMAVSSIVPGKIGNPEPFRQPTGDQNRMDTTTTTEQPSKALNNNATTNFDLGANKQPLNNINQNKGPSFQQQQQQKPQQFNKQNAPPNSLAPPSSSSFASSSSSNQQPLSMDTPSKIFPIASLNPYLNRWTIKARVTQKSSIRTWSNSRGEGQLFSMNLIDQSGEIRATLFKNEVDKFYNMIEVNKVYYIRKAILKVANKQYSNLNNEYELTFTGETEVIPCAEGDDDSEGQQLPMISFNFVDIDKLEQIEPNTVIDVIGVVKECGDLKVVTSKQSSKEVKKRDITLVDKSQVQIKLTLWGNDAENFEGEGNPVIAVKGVRLSDWGGRSLSQSTNCQLLVNPDIPECHSLRGWFDSVGQGIEYMEYKKEGASQSGATNWKTFSELKAQPSDPDQATYFLNKATISVIKREHCLYKACPQPDCNKKVVDDGNSSYRCEKCAKEFSSFKWRLLLQMNLCDSTDNQWVTCFQDTAEGILNTKADEIGRLKEMNSPDYDQIFNAANFTSYIFKLRSKMEKYNDESQLKTICMQATPVNFVEYNNRLLSELAKHLGPV